MLGPAALACHVNGARSRQRPHLLGLVQLGTEPVQVCSGRLEALLNGSQLLFHLSQVPLHIPARPAGITNAMQDLVTVCVCQAWTVRQQGPPKEHQSAPQPYYMIPLTCVKITQDRPQSALDGMLIKRGRILLA